MTKVDFKGHEFMGHIFLDTHGMTGYSNTYRCRRCGHFLNITKEPSSPAQWSQTTFEPCTGINTGHKMEWVATPPAPPTKGKKVTVQQRGHFACAKCGKSWPELGETCAFPDPFVPAAQPLGGAQ